MGGVSPSPICTATDRRICHDCNICFAASWSFVTSLKGEVNVCLMGLRVSVRNCFMAGKDTGMMSSTSSSQENPSWWRFGSYSFLAACMFTVEPWNEAASMLTSVVVLVGFFFNSRCGGTRRRWLSNRTQRSGVT